MQESPLRIVVLGMERLLPKDSALFDTRAREALVGVDAARATFAGYPPELVQRVAGLFGAQTGEDRDEEPDLLLYVYSGIEDAASPAWRRVQRFIDAHGEAAVRYVILPDETPIAAPVRYVDTYGSFAYDALLIACPEDAAAAQRVQAALAGMKVSRDASKRAGRRQLQGLVLSTGEALQLQEREMMAQTRNLVVLVSEHSVRCPKVNEAVAAFIAVRGKAYIQLVLAGSTRPAPGEPDNPTALFPPQLVVKAERQDSVTGETVKEIIEEPLASDFRGAGIEQQQLYRLAAPLFGLTYEDLNRRMWQQRFRRIAIAAGVALAVALAVIGTLLTTGLGALNQQKETDANRANAEIALANEEKAAIEAQTQALEAQKQADEAQTAADEAEAAAKLAQEKADEAEKAAKDAADKAAEAVEAAGEAQLAALYANSRLIRAAIEENRAIRLLADAEQAAAEADEAARLAGEAAAEAARLAKEADEQAAAAVTARDLAQEKAEEAVTRGADALLMQATRQTREAEQAEENGDVLGAIQLLLDATPFEGSTRALYPRAEMRLRTLLGKGEVFPVLTLPGYTQPEIDGEVLYAVDAQGRAAAWNLRTGEAVAAGGYAPAIDRPQGMPAIAIGEKTFTTDARGYAQLRDAEGFLLEEILAHTPGRPQGLLTALEGRRIVSHTGTETVVWAVVPGNARTVIFAHNGAVTAFDITDESFVTGGRDGRVHIWALDGTQQASFNTGGRISSVELLPEMDRLVTCQTNGTVTLWDTQSGRSLWSRSLRGAQVARISPDGTRVVAGNKVETDANYDPWTEPSHPGYMLDGADGRTLMTFETGGIPWYGEIFYKDGFIVGTCKVLTFYDTQLGTERWTYDDFPYGDWSNAIITGSRMVYSRTAIFSSTSWTQWWGDYYPHSREVLGIPTTINTNYNYLSISQEMSVMINWATTNPKRTRDMEYVMNHRYRHKDVIVGGAYARDGRYAITASRDGDAAVLNDNGLMQLLHNVYPLTWADFLPDSSAAITVDEEGRIVLWPLGDFSGVRARAEELMKP